MEKRKIRYFYCNANANTDTCANSFSHGNFFAYTSSIAISNNLADNDTWGSRI